VTTFKALIELADPIVPAIADITPFGSMATFWPAANSPRNKDARISIGTPWLEITRSDPSERPDVMPKAEWSSPSATNVPSDRLTPNPMSTCSGLPDPILVSPEKGRRVHGNYRLYRC